MINKKQIVGKVPELRFPEFHGTKEWENKRLEEICKKISQGGTPDTFISDYWNGDIEWLTPAEMGKSKTRFIKTTNRKISKLGLKNCPSNLLPINSVILSTRAPIGHLLINTSEMAINQGCKGLTPSPSLDHNFLYYSLYGNKNALANLGAGNTFKELSGSTLKNFKLPISTLPEQKKIADCMSSLDDIITAQTQKIETLKAHKKGLMQQLFPAEGKTVPRLRFPEFQGAREWEEAHLKDMLKETARPVKMSSEQDYGLVTVKRRYGGIVLRDILKGKSIKVKKQFLLQENDFLISKRQIIHNACGLVPKEFENSIVSNEYSILKSRKKCNIQYINWFSQHPKISESFLLSSRGVVIEKMLFDLDDWLKRKFLFPSLPEQQKIADCLCSLANLINVHSQKLDDLKTFKKGLMQRLFLSTFESQA